MIGVRYRKLLRDLRLMWTRMVMMVVAIALSLTAVGAVLSARAVLQREITASYLGTRPASATLELAQAPSAEQMASVRAQPEVLDATKRHTLQARMHTPSGWKQLLLFEIAPDDPLTVNRFALQTGQWPTGSAQMLVERSSMAYFGLHDGDRVTVRGPGGQTLEATIAGTVHDGGVAPSAQETIGYAYVTPSFVEGLGEAAGLDDLKILVSESANTEAVAQQTAALLARQGAQVERIQIPPARAHPHQNQLNTVGTLLLVFALLAFVLAAILIATMIGGMLAQQVRQIAVMKVVGAGTRQILGLYLTLTLGIAATATTISLPLATMLGRTLAGVVAGLLNVDLTSQAVPIWVPATQALAGLLVPLLIALVPLLRGSRVTVRQAIDDHGVTAVRQVRVRPARNRALAMAWRNLFRRRARLALALTLLASAGAIFLTGLSTAGGWSALAAQGTSSRHYDLEVRLAQPVAADRLLESVGSVPGVTGAEAWTSLPAEVAKGGQVPVARTYPDGGHGSFSLVAVPPDTKLVTPTVQSGRWLRPGDTDAVVINQLVPYYQGRMLAVGQDVELTVNGASHRWHIVGTVADFGSQGSAYVSPEGLRAATGVSGSNLLRVVAPDPAATADRVEQALVAGGFGVRVVLPVAQLAEALDGHVGVLIIDLLAIALVMAVVGLLGLASTMSTSVLERTREFAVMKAVGATPAVLRGIVLREAVLTAVLSLAFAIAAAAPLTALVGGFVGRQAFHLPLPFQLNLPGIALWALAAVGGSALAGLAAARRAANTTVREALTAL